MADTLTVVFSVTTGSAVFIICLACLLYKCRAIEKQQKGNALSDASGYDDVTISEEDQLMIPVVERVDTIESLRHQLSQGLHR